MANRAHLALLALLIPAAAAHAGDEGRRFELTGTIASNEPRLFLGPVRYATLYSTGSSYVSRTPVDRVGRFKFKKLAQGTYIFVFGVPRSRPLRKTIEIGPSFADKKGRINAQLAFERKAVSGRPNTVPATQLAVPDSARFEFFKGQEHLDRRETARAREAFQRAIDIAPQFAAAWNSLGTAELQSERYEDAERALRRALDLNPSYYGPLLTLASTLMMLGKSEEALKFNLRAVKLRPDDPQAQSQLGHSYYYLGRLEEAEPPLREAKTLEPGHYTLPQLLLAEIYVHRGDYERAVRELEEFLKLHPDVQLAHQARTALVAARQKLAAKATAPDR
jgi:tetratricopeptide (TPR) repeat protein